MIDRTKIHEIVNKKLENYVNEEKNFKTYSWDAPSYAEITDFVLDQAQETIQSIREENQALREALEFLKTCQISKFAKDHINEVLNKAILNGESNG